MTQARKTIVSLDDTPFYHCVSRCVRRAFLCGEDHYSGNSYEHRRQWLEDKLHEVASIFSIKLCAYAVMSNHYHVVLHVRRDIALEWSDEEVVKRWHSLYSGNLLSQRFHNDSALSEAELSMLQKDIAKWRDRLCSISWFMRVVNEFIAIKANREDKCTGRFWEGRFKSQALLDETAVLTCMAYVDLNPIRAGLSTTPETSDFTSIQTRLNRKPTKSLITPKSLLPFAKDKMKNNDVYIPITKAAYFELVDWTGRCIRNDKRGAIPHNVAPILDRININEHEWLRQTQYFEARFKRVAGSWQSIKLAAKRFGKSWFQGKPPKPKPLSTE